MSRRPFVGRSHDLDELSELLALASGGHGCVVLVRGPAGVGKTRLVEEAVSRLDEDVRVGRGYAADDLGTAPLWPWVRACAAAGLDGAVAALTDPPKTAAGTEAEVGAERLRWMTGIVDRLVAATDAHPVALVLEDLHWADSATLDLLRHLAPVVPGVRLAVVVTSRSGAPGVESVLGRVQRFPGTSELALESLTVDDVATYLSSTGASPSAAHRVHRESGGLPLLVTAARVGHESATPYDVRSIVLAMLDSTGAEARPVLEAAAVLGEDLDHRLLAAIAEVPGTTVTRAVAAGARSGLLDKGGERFVHALLRDGLIAALPPERLLTLRRRAGLELAATGAPAARAVGQLRLAGDDPDVLDARARLSRRAADQAARALAYGDAVRFLLDVEDALLRGGCDAVTLAEARLETAAAQYLDGRTMDALAGCRRVSRQLAGTGRPDLVAAAALVVRGLQFPEADEALIALAEAALREEGQPPAVRSRLLAQVVAAEAGAGRPQRVESAAVEAWRLAQGVDDAETFLDAARARESTLMGPGDDEERLALADAAVARATPLGRPVPLVLAQGWRIRAGYALARLDVARDGFDELTSLAARTGLVLAQWHLARAVTARAALEGRFDVAVAANIEARELAHRSADPAAAGLTTAVQTHLAILRGDPSALPDEGFEGAPDVPLVWLMRTASELLVGDRDAAETTYARLRRLLWAPDVDLLWGGVLLRMIDVVEAFDDREAAAVLTDRLEPWAGVAGAPGIHTAYFERSPAGQLGRALVVCGRTQDAEPFLRRGLASHDTVGAEPYAVLSRLDLATLLAADRPQEARRLATTAATRAHTLDMPSSTTRAMRLLADLARAERSRDPLSPREREIAELVVAALSNRDIAHRLVISERTVETHVRAVLGKLGCVNRTELVARRAEVGL